MRLGEDNIGASTTRRADFTALRPIWPLTARFGLANARPLASTLARRAGHPVDAGWEGTGWARGAAALAVQYFFNFEATGGYTPKTRGKEVYRVA